MELDPQVKALLTAIMAAGDPPVEILSAPQARDMAEPRYEKLKFPLLQPGSVEDKIIHGPLQDLALRIYTPHGKGPFPVLLFIHGGGWVLFRPKHYESLCTHLCVWAGCVVVSVDYRRSPETKFPGALDDCLTALKWIVRNADEISGDISKLIVAGDSAGGNLAAAAALRNRDEKGPDIRAQILLYPVTAWYDPSTPSFVEFSDGYSLTSEGIKWFWEQYLDKTTDTRDPYVSPLFSEDLSRLPETLMIVSGYDPLRDEGIRFAEKLRKSGVKTTLRLYEGMIHGFISYPGILDQALTAVREICAWLKERMI